MLMQKKKIQIVRSVVALLFVSTSLFSQKDTTAVRYSKIITADALETHLTVIASDAFEGRETGKQGQKLAADYIQGQFKSFGIPPYKEDTYYQTYSLQMVLPKAAEIKLKGRFLEAKKDFYHFPGLSEQTIDAKEVVFLGYGIEEKNYNDYANNNVKDKVVMILSGEPYKQDGTSIISGTKEASLWTTYYKNKIQKAREQGAKLLLVVVDDVPKNVEKNKHRLESSSLKLDNSGTEMPVIYISTEVANTILKKKKVEDLKANISKTEKPQALKAKAELSIVIKNLTEKVLAENVLGYVEGSDLKEELIVITAHYDHLGKEGDVVFNGADDDGSGTVAVIELAEAFAKAKKEGHGPRRSMLFMTVSGEEKGLLGSAYYTENPEFPLKNTVCDLNIDMIGRLDEKHANNSNYVYLIGSDKLSSELHQISENANKTYSNLELDYTFNDEKDKNRFYYRSDHYNFAKNGIPVIFYFNGVHSDYHKETDEVAKIDFNKMEKITRLVFFTAWELANRTARIKVDSNKK
jgi:hypothetical protein